MKSESLVKVLGLLVRLDLGVGVEFQPPFLTGKVNDRDYKILCAEVQHVDGNIKMLTSPSHITNLFLYINNKKGNNIVLLTTKTTHKLLMRDVSMIELADGIMYKNEMELYENNILG